MEDISTATATSTSTAPRRDNALLNQSLDDIIKLNRTQRRSDKKKPDTSRRSDKKNTSSTTKPSRFNNKNRSRNDKMMDTTPIVGKPRHQPNQRSSQSTKVVIRSNSGRPASFKPQNNNNSNRRSTPGLRQPWEKLPTAPLPVEPLKISIRNELAERSSRRSDMMMDTDTISGPMSASSAPSSSYHHRPMSASAPAYEPRDSLASREEYRIGNRFSTQGMAIDYQLPSGASYDTRPTRRF